MLSVSGLRLLGFRHEGLELWGFRVSGVSRFVGVSIRVSILVSTVSASKKFYTVLGFRLFRLQAAGVEGVGFTCEGFGV